jgi:hypothetical protein
VQWLLQSIIDRVRVTAGQPFVLPEPFGIRLDTGTFTG